MSIQNPSFLLQTLLFIFLFLFPKSTSQNPQNPIFKRFIISLRRPNGVIPQEFDNLILSTISNNQNNNNNNNNNLFIQTPQLLHSYSTIFSGFSALLTDSQLTQLSNSNFFLKSIPDPVYSPQTTHSPKFLNFLPPSLNGLLNISNQGQGIIIGLLDTGISPQHPSFFNHNLPPPPPNWKGSCNFIKIQSCSNKLIGAQSFISGEQFRSPPLDNDGHGTHTASTAAGSPVPHASAFGNAAGTAIGMAPRAHIAEYKVCADDICYGSDIVAGFEAAIHDGVDIISLSLGGQSPPFFYEDFIAISSFAAMSKGILVSASAGNSGPEPSTVSNDAPWILTVAASTMDRKLVSIVKLGNGKVFKGETLKQNFPARIKMVPLVFPGMNGDEQVAACVNNSLSGFDIAGKAVVCVRGINGRIEKGAVVKESGGVAMILLNGEIGGYSTLADGHVIPASHLSYADGKKIIKYIRKKKNPKVSILFKGTKFNAPFSPSIIDFSSRGPSKISPGILKPDITGPGVNVLAAWNEIDEENKKPIFNVISGTSMSCPHLSGIAALIKAAQPDWSPAAIKSALMTTADVVDRNKKAIFDERRHVADFYAIGAGHVNPERALNPGFVYDLKEEDYFPYLCGLGYDESMIYVIIKREINCSEVGRIKEAELNYPSFSMEIGFGESVTLKRTLTNVGEGGQRYRAEIEEMEGVEVEVEPKELTSGEKGQKLTFKISLKRIGEGIGKGYLKWVSQKYMVRSPILVT